MASSGTEILLIRHGVTEWNRARRFQGQVDVGLDAEGVAQARRLAARLAREAREGRPIAAVYSSDLARARQTAAEVAAALGRELRVEPGLRERSYGAFEGRTPAELERDLPHAYARWHARDPDFELPGGGESLRRLHDRVHAALVALAARHDGERVAAVTHGGVLDVAYRIASGTPLHAARRFDLPNAGVNRVRWDGRAFALLGWADVGHLSDDRGPAEAPGEVDARGAAPL